MVSPPPAYAVAGYSSVLASPRTQKERLMTTNLTLHTALGNLPITAPLRDGSVTIPGVTIEDVGKTDYVDIWRTQARTVEYDVSLMSVVSFLCAREHGIDRKSTR